MYEGTLVFFLIITSLFVNEGWKNIIDANI